MTNKVLTKWNSLCKTRKQVVLASILIIFVIGLYLLCPKSTSNFFTLIKDISIATAALLTAYFAKEGLVSWRSELSGKANFDVARKMARASYKLRNELEYCRSPWMPLNEFPDDYDPTKRTSKSEADAYHHIYSNRWKPVAEALKEFEVEALEAEVLWGNEFKVLTDELKQCCRNLQVAMEAHISNIAEDGEDFKHDPEFGKQIKEDIMNINRKNNPLTQKIENAVFQIEQNIKPHIKTS